MITQSSADIIRSQLAAHLVDFMLSEDDVALDIIEFIALRMPERHDYQIAVLGYFVRANLFYLTRDMISFSEVLERLAHAASQAPLGHEALTQSLDASASHYHL